MINPLFNDPLVKEAVETLRPKKQGKHKLDMVHPNTGKTVTVWLDRPPTKELASQIYESLREDSLPSSESITGTKKAPLVVPGIQKEKTPGQAVRDIPERKRPVMTSREAEGIGNVQPVDIDAQRRTAWLQSATPADLIEANQKANGSKKISDLEWLAERGLGSMSATEIRDLSFGSLNSKIAGLPEMAADQLPEGLRTAARVAIGAGSSLPVREFVASAVTSPLQSAFTMADHQASPQDVALAGVDFVGTFGAAPVLDDLIKLGGKAVQALLKGGRGITDKAIVDALVKDGVDIAKARSAVKEVKQYAQSNSDGYLANLGKPRTIKDVENAVANLRSRIPEPPKALPAPKPKFTPKSDPNYDPGTPLDIVGMGKKADKPVAPDQPWLNDPVVKRILNEQRGTSNIPGKMVDGKPVTFDDLSPAQITEIVENAQLGLKEGVAAGQPVPVAIHTRTLELFAEWKAKRQATPKPPPPAARKEPWEMTRDEYVSAQKTTKEQRSVLARAEKVKRVVESLGWDIEKGAQIPSSGWRDIAKKAGIKNLYEFSTPSSEVVKVTDLGNGYVSIRATDTISERQHAASIYDALSEGKPVPPEVLADYPDLVKKGGAEVKAKPQRSKQDVINEFNDASIRPSYAIGNDPKWHEKMTAGEKARRERLDKLKQELREMATPDDVLAAAKVAPKKRTALQEIFADSGASTSDEIPVTAKTYKTDRIGVNQVNGEAWWTNSHVAFKGNPPHPQTEGYSPPIERVIPERLNRGASKFIGSHVKAMDKEAKAVVRYVFEDPSGELSTLDGKYVQSARKIFGKDVEFHTNGNKPALVIKDGEVVGVIMPMDASGIEKARFAPTKTQALKSDIADIKGRLNAKAKERNSGGAASGGGAFQKYFEMSKEEYADLLLLAQKRTQLGVATVEEFVEWVRKEIGDYYTKAARQVWQETHGVKRGEVRTPAKPPEAKPTPEPKPTGASMATRTMQAEELGTRNPTSISGKTDKEVVEAGKKMIDDGYDVPAELRKKAQAGQPANEDEIGAIIVHRDRLIEDLRGLNKRLDGELDTEIREAVNTQKEDLIRQIEDFDRDLDEVKAANGRSLGRYRIGQTQSIKSVEEYRIEAKRLTGVEPSNAQVKKVEALLKQQDEIIKVRDAKIKELEASKADDAVATVFRQRRSRSVEAIRKDRTEAIARVQQKLREGRQTVGTSPLQAAFETDWKAIAGDVKIIVKSYVEELKLKTTKELAAKLGEDFPELKATEDDIRRVLAGVYDEPTKKPRSAYQQLVDESKRLQNELETAELESGAMRNRKMSDRLKAIEKELVDMQKADELAEVKAGRERNRKMEERLKEIEAQLRAMDRADNAAKLKAERDELNRALKADRAAESARKKAEAKRLSEIRKELQKADEQTRSANNAERKKLLGRAGKLYDLNEQLSTGVIPEKSKRTVQLSEEALQMDEKIKAVEAKLRIMAREKNTGVIGKANKVIQSAALLNPLARVIDVVSNTSKMASFIAQNPLRSTLQVASKQIGKENYIGLQTLKNVFRNAPTRWKEEVKLTLQGYDMDTIMKWGNPTLGSRVAGTTDVPFRDIYYRLALDDFAVSKAKTLGKTNFKQNRQAIFDQLTGMNDGPLSLSEVSEAKAIAHEWSLRQTYNNDNMITTALSGAKSGAVRMVEKSNGKAAAEAVALGFDTVTRFNKVITNVVLDRVNYTPAGALEAAIRTLATRKGRNVKDLRLITDLASKGLVGSALVVFGYKNPELLDGIADFEIVQTEGNVRFVKWTLFKSVGGGLDMTQFSGFVPPYVLGAAMAKIDSATDLTEKQREALKWSFGLEWGVHTPVYSNVKDVTGIFDPTQKPGKKIGQLAARQVIPSAVSEIATRTDEVELRKTDNFWEPFINRVPWWRKTLPSNMKQVTKVGKP